jgi:DNA-binding NtrC family response regulator
MAEAAKIKLSLETAMSSWYPINEVGNCGDVAGFNLNRKIIIFGPPGIGRNGMAKILVVDDNPSFRFRLAEQLRTDLGCEVFEAANGAEALEMIRKHSPDLMILDLALPDMHGTEVFRQAMKLKSDMEVVVLTGYGTSKIALDMGREGVREFIDKGSMSFRGIAAAVGRLLAQWARRPQVAKKLATVDPPSTLWMEGESAAIKKTLKAIGEVAPTDIAVVIEGEEGTCKVDVARFIHNKSRRSRRSFVVVNCRFFPSAHADHLFYGYTKECLEDGGEGSDGYFKRAEGGTLLFHHIEDLVPEVQQKLIRVLKEKVYCRLGDEREFKLNTRIMATTDIDLPGLVKDGLILEELMQVLAPVTIKVPSLQERMEDIPLLAEKCLAVACKTYIPHTAQAIFRNYHKQHFVKPG